MLPPPRPQWANRMGLVALTLVLLTLAAAGGGFVGAYLTAKSGTTLAARAPDMPAVPMIGATAEPAAERVAAVPANDPPAMADAATPKAEAPAPASEPVTVAAAAPPAEPAPRIDVAPAPVAPIVTADPEPTKSGPAATEVAIAEPIAADPPKAEPTKAEVVKVEPANNDTAMSGPSMAATVPAVPAQVVIMSMERGDELMKEGDIVGARRFYEIAASSGDPRAATAVGRTFDPAYLQQAGIRGPQSNSAKARQWYEKAMRGGDTEARLLLFRLSALSARH